MTENDKYSIDDLIVSAMDEKPLDFEAAFDSLVKDRLVGAIADRKVELAKSLYVQPEAEAEIEPASPEEVETEE